jgi:hypothetical protein
MTWIPMAHCILSLKGYFMNKYVHQSTGTQPSSTPKIHETAHPGPAPTHSQIAQRAYEIYVESGCRQNLSLQNWLQAEQELMNSRHWRQAERQEKDHSMATTASR